MTSTKWRPFSAKQKTVNIGFKKYLKSPENLRYNSSSMQDCILNTCSIITAFDANPLLVIHGVFIYLSKGFEKV